MPTLRLFANLREAAGSAEIELSGSTVGEIVDAAVARYGEAFERGLEVARIWVNGEPADRSTPVGVEDEIAIIPPVSGGATSTTKRSPVPTLQTVSVLALAAALVIAGLLSLQTFVFVTVGATIAWLWDLHDVARLRGEPLNAVAPLVAVTLAANAAYRWGISGFAGGVAAGVMLALVWAVVRSPRRRLDDIALTVLMAVAGTTTAGAFVITRMRSTDEAVAVIAIAAAGAVAAWATERYAADIAGIDPQLAAFVAAIGAGLLAGALFDDLSLAVMALGGAAVAAGLVAGRVLGSLIRTGAVLHTERAPGLLTMFDGPALAIPLFWIVVTIFA